MLFYRITPGIMCLVLLFYRITHGIFKHKFRAYGSLERYMAHWVLRGFSQRPGVDFSETFSPVVKPALFTQCSLWLSLGAGLFISLTSRMFFCMVP